MNAYHEDDIRDKFNILNAIVYPYGSRVYATHRYGSDYDYIVVDDSVRDGDEERFFINKDEINIHFHSTPHWLEMISEHKIFALESILQEPSNGRFRPTFKLDKSKLRKEISEKSSNSWVKCKKKLVVEHDYRIGLKSLFHSFRIIDFGIQIARDGCINEYRSARMQSLFSDIMDSFPFLNVDSAEDEWNTISVKYKPLHNEMLTEFRKLAPK